MWKEFIVPSCLATFTIVLAWVLRIKANSDKADVEKIVDNKLLETNKEIDELKKTQEFFKEAIQDITKYNELAAEKSKNTRRNIQDTLDRQEKTFKEFAEEQRIHNAKLLEIVGQLTTKQAVIDATQPHS